MYLPEQDLQTTPVLPLDHLIYVITNDDHYPHDGFNATYQLQRYHQDAKSQAFQADFARSIPLQLHLIRTRNKRGRSGAFPQLLDFHPELPLPDHLPDGAEDDPVIKLLDPHLRLTFRYLREEGVGYLVHLGFDWQKIDDASLLPLWRTAVNLQRTD